MTSIAFLLVALFTVYIACTRPPWFWTAIVAGATLLEVLAIQLHVAPVAIPLGPLLVRSTDPGVLGVCIGCLYYMHGRRSRFLRGRPLGALLVAVLVFLALKVLASVLFYHDAIWANRVASHAFFGLVAALGDVRDGMLPFIFILYAYAARKSFNLKALGWPVVCLLCILLLKSAVGIAHSGVVWTGTGDPEKRFIPSDNAIHLTLFGFLLLFLKVPRVKPIYSRALALLSLLTATVANHRSQWIAEVTGCVVLLAILILGRPLVSRHKQMRITFVGCALLLTMAFAVIAYLQDAGRRIPLLDSLTVRLYAVTEPSRDPDAKWRQDLWKDRITQVGSDWPWGRPFGARFETLYHGDWMLVPPHSAYVQCYELGGAIWCLIVLLFWGRAIQIALIRLLQQTRRAYLWPAALALTIAAMNLAFGSAYNFPYLGPALVAVLLLGGEPDPEDSRDAVVRPERAYLTRQQVAPLTVPSG